LFDADGQRARVVHGLQRVVDQVRPDLVQLIWKAQQRQDGFVITHHLHPDLGLPLVDGEHGIHTFCQIGFNHLGANVKVRE